MPLRWRRSAFFLAHELGHVRLRMTEPDALDDHAEELSADAQAMGMVVRAFRHPQAGMNPLHWLGLEMGLMTFAALEHMGMDFGTTHPPFWNRLADVRRQAELLPLLAPGERALMGDVGRQCEAIYTEVLRVLAEPTGEEADSLNALEKWGLARFHELLAHCAGPPGGDLVRMTADHGGFAAGMSALMDAGQARVVLTECARILSGRSAEPVPPAMDNPQAWLDAFRFNQLRVVAGWCGQHRRPEIRGLLERHHRQPAG